VVTLTQDYVRLFEDLQQQVWLRRARALAAKLMDRVVLAGGATVPLRGFNASPDMIVTYTGWGGREWEKDAGVAFGAADSGEDGIAREEHVMPAFTMAQPYFFFQ